MKVKITRYLIPLLILTIIITFCSFSCSTPGPGDQPVVESEPNIALEIVELAKSQIGKLTGDGPFAGLIWADSEITYCDRFVSAVMTVASGKPLSERKSYLTAYDDYIAHEGLIKSGEPPKGTVVYYGKHKENWNCGHVGISDGEGNIISVVNRTKGVDITPRNYFKAPLLGWVTFKEYESQEEAEEEETVEEEALDESESEFIQSSSYQAELLPNGITFGNVSIALTEVVRSHYSDSKKDNVMFYFTLRKIKTSIEPYLKLFFEAIDDHENIYDTIKVTVITGRRFDPFHLDAWIANQAPIGFTWVVPVGVLEIPSAAPLIKLNIYYPGREYNPNKRETWTSGELTTIDLSTFKPVEVIDFYSHLKEQDCLFLPYKIDIDKYFSMTIHKIKKEQETLIIPITFKNDDYNSYTYSLEGMGIQDANGEIIRGSYTGYEGATLPEHRGFTTSVPGLSQKTIEIHIKKREEGMPKAILFYSLPGKTSDNIIILKISPENFE